MSKGEVVASAMRLMLDSASPSDVERARELGFVSGVTTNPALIGDQSPSLVLDALLDVCDWPLFYQSASGRVEQAEAELREILGSAPERIVPKLPARGDFFGLASRLVSEGFTCAITSVFAPGQGIAASAAGCQWVIPYVDRARRLRPESLNIVADLAAVLKAGEPTRILAASIKTPAQVVSAFRDGAQAVTAPLGVLEQLTEDPLSLMAIDQFAGGGA